MNRASFLPADSPPDGGIDFVLTPQERDIAALGTLHLERMRREQNHRNGLAGPGNRHARETGEPT